ncbi:PBP1A family penicillin-binding protein [Hydrogenophaga borbori]|uniref:Penicillin-binding protein 1A n=2 Tax=Hydrogenophaga borbori TaxID=2294117 RepID=A0A372EHX3_9BURK|nr:PBP1A family penicillin-binding protein [Hydrogenophaga borbori]
MLHRLWQALPSVEALTDYQPKLPLRIHARDGRLLAEFGEERRELVAIEQIPKRMREALLAIEDANFYQHRGVDFSGLARAAWRNLFAGGHAQGGSTITMQVARLFFLSREKTYHRKIMEVLLAYKLETRYGKDTLLELYMNQVYLGERAYGFAAAASVYFDKGLHELSLAEAAMLAGLPKAPSAYNPVVNRERAVVRQRHILSRLLALGWIDQAAHDQALAEPLVLRAPGRFADLHMGHAVEQARQRVVERFGDAAYTRGLDVVLSIDADLQREAMRALRTGLLSAQQQRGYAGPEARLPAPWRFDRAGLRRALAAFPDSGALQAALVREVSSEGLRAHLRDGRLVALALGPGQGRRIEVGSVIRVQRDATQGWRLAQLPRMEGALVSIDMDNGHILALAGGFDPRLGQYDHALQALRQPGSTFKPFVYSAALERGYFPGTLVEDRQRVVTPAAPGRRAWAPRNYGGRYDGFLTVRDALARSRNVATVNLMEAAGPAHVRDFAARFGFDPQHNPPTLPLALGAGAVSPLGLAQAYAVFGSGGEWRPAVLITRVSVRDGTVLFEADARAPAVRAVSERNAYIMDSMLRGVVQQGTARRALRLARSDVAGKTGTSNQARDVWFAGYSSGVSTVVWMGYDQPRSLGRATGATHALPVWTEFMARAVADRTPSERERPAGVALLAGDYAYAEYADRACVRDDNDRVAGPFDCAPGASLAPPTGVAQERASPARCCAAM